MIIDGKPETSVKEDFPEVVPSQFSLFPKFLSAFFPVSDILEHFNKGIEIGMKICSRELGLGKFRVREQERR